MDKSTLYLQDIPFDTKSINVLLRLLDIDFPMSERIPLFLLRATLKKKKLRSVYLTDGRKNYGYTIYQYVADLQATHLLYLAVLPEYRSCGIGGVMMEKLNELFDNRIILDAEDPEKAKTEKSKAICEKRIAFYTRNGYNLLSDFKFSNFGFYLRVMVNFQPKKMEWLTLYRKIYKNASGFPLTFIMIQKEH